ncbi:GntR family transcriptional regulator [Pollutimonas thiosulfatoxidans]|uniref:HTH gntR-type domain-containing protein n=1 Tax=Pollutimonas thiosulfatoxidans TaxID=2028345 RepID=A0A410GBR7_9BURK|nr:GntR family transcriptional regulator [Pollutimonas thiosulfatoxidans]MBF6615816.1 GntR family transcriptional regulator [Candidimonas sp.]NYT44764.1 GntR family transcriptional regulator [Alcaligenaceae bacterium]QAA93728.1 hypothetical protein CKA81_07685 [Pollutimonas thiosulfatoxidans]
MARTGQHGHTAEQAYHWIRDRILRNYWPAASQLKEGELATEIGVSRTPVREALRRLTQEGLVETVPNLGSRLRSWTSTDLEEIFGLRMVLESYAARLAATRINAEELDALYKLCTAMEQLVEQGMDNSQARHELTRLNEQYHAAIMAASHSPRLMTLAQQVISFPLVYRTFSSYRLEEINRSMAHHRELADAFGSRDPIWAESVMRAHLAAGHEAIRHKLSRDNL